MNIFKFPLKQLFGKQEISVPAGSYPMTAQMQNDELVLWVRTGEHRDVTMTVWIVGTGDDWLKDASATYVATVQKDDLVYHVFAACYWAADDVREGNSHD